MAKIIISNTNLIVWRIFELVFIMMCLSACQSIVPAVAPSQLSHTPSAPIIITDTRIEASWFSLDYPDNWRVVTNIASQPLHLIIVSPDDDTVIHIEDARDGCIVAPDESQWLECPGADNTQLAIWVEQKSTSSDPYEPIVEALVNSITFR